MSSKFEDKMGGEIGHGDGNSSRLNFLSKIVSMALDHFIIKFPNGLTGHESSGFWPLICICFILKLIGN